MKILFLALVIARMVFGGPVEGKRWTSGELITRETFKYGAFEACLRAAKGSGMVTTFFLWKDGSEEPGARWQEMDFEIFGKDGSFQSQVMTPGSPRTQHFSFHIPDLRADRAFHVYRMEWTPRRLAFLLDDSLLREETDTAQYGELLDSTRAQPMQLRTGLWAQDDPSWSGRFDSTAVPSESRVGWIRVWDRVPDRQGDRFLPRWSEEFDRIDTARWWKAEWTFPLSVSDYLPANLAARDGCLVETFCRRQSTGSAP